MTKQILMARARALAVAGLALAACSSETTDNFVNPPPAPPDTCAVIASLPGCDQGAISYACTADRPDDNADGTGDTDLVCSGGAPGGGSSTLYCCIPYAQRYSECVPDTTIPGCGGVSAGFTCSGETTPSDADPTIACSAALGAADGTHSYCCNTIAIPATCAVDPAVACDVAAVGYACVTGATPADGGVPLTCLAGAQSGGSTEFCCASATE